MRASRLLSLLLLLQNRGRMSAPALAAELDVSVRTVYRDINALAAAGVPVYGEHGPLGGYQLLDGYRTRLTGLTPAEAEALFLSGMPQPAAELGLGANLAAAELKLTAALPVSYREASGRIRERFHLDARGWFREPDDVPHLLTVADAVWRERRVRIRYRRWEPTRETVTRTLDPLGLVLKAGTWYLVAARGGKPRTYRVATIRSIEILDDEAIRPPGFDLAAHWASGVAEYESRVSRTHARVSLSPRGFADLTDLLPTVPKRAGDDAAPPDADGWREVTLPMESTGHAVGQLLRFGRDARVLGPPELVEAMAAEVAAVADFYR
ncbi:helix-turn-helix transcriptional regulator [Phytomonospora endophytica]|uniref:Putative DNA-binding transcriptional regulator YafY n=1 Tax=Phytomonospora endophytica TaxID=714109 RepID=A0A841FSK1_9ACTN|nr:WYL domain-containing protein [Phytomonospora endophytica]MBB6039016.1 putative DNA-binding transcriptional regulator YafY [Phytomonospora endophytica]GIG69494.1 transcriptional regulator [Phytomonospora endophytica]